jgi:SAM-dependent methyltransferase
MWAQTPDTVAQSVLALCDDLVRQGIDLAVREEDEMYQIFLWGQGGDRDRGLAMYFTSGRALWQTIEPLLRWRFGDPARIARLLDFASGYGRLTRFLELAVPPERIWVADIQPEAVRAQEEQFGVHGILSSTEPDELVLEGSFDVILVCRRQPSGPGSPA